MSFGRCQVSSSIPDAYWNLWDVCALSLSGCWLFQTCSPISVLSPEVFYTFFSDPSHFPVVCPSALPLLLTEPTGHFCCSFVFSKAFNQFPWALDTPSSSDDPRKPQDWGSCFLVFVIFRDLLKIYFQDFFSFLLTYITNSFKITKKEKKLANWITTIFFWTISTILTPVNL